LFCCLQLAVAHGHDILREGSKSLKFEAIEATCLWFRQTYAHAPQLMCILPGPTKTSVMQQQHAAQWSLLASCHTPKCGVIVFQIKLSSPA
jgi:hypothetical protein